MSAIKRYYRPELDALRFFAFLCVFLDHQPIMTAWIQPFLIAGAFGMCMFFMLSAYLIVSILMRERANTGTVNLRSFAIRRILRIWPLYFLVLFGGFALGRVWEPSFIRAKAVLAFSFLLGNVLIMRQCWMGALNPLWSLSVEEQFYLVVPALARWSASRVMAAVCVSTILLSYVVLLRLGHTGTDAGLVWANSFVQFQFFAAGGLMAMWRYGRVWRIATGTRMVLVFVGVCLWLGAGSEFSLHSDLHTTSSSLVRDFSLMMSGTVCLFLSALDTEKKIPGVITYLGKISYGLYLFHDFYISFVAQVLSQTFTARPMLSLRMDLLAAPVAMGMTILTAAISYRFFEAPILRYKERFETVLTRGV
jgi:peptidoglycan/LPS O-acetylase OafA/YrhL